MCGWRAWREPAEHLRGWGQALPPPCIPPGLLGRASFPRFWLQVPPPTGLCWAPLSHCLPHLSFSSLKGLRAPARLAVVRMGSDTGVEAPGKPSALAGACLVAFEAGLAPELPHPRFCARIHILS